MENVIGSHVYYSLNINGEAVPFITDAVICMFVIVLAVALILFFLTRNLRKVPKGGQNVAEIIVELIGNLAKGQLGHHAKVFTPYLATVLIFLVFSNMIALFNIIPSGKTLSAIFKNPALENFEFGLHPPTRNINVTLCLALISIVIVIISEFRFKGMKGWAKSFYKPTPVSGLIKTLDYVVRPLSLCLRLFGNILGGAIIMTLIYNLSPLVAPAIVGIYFDLFDGGLQAYVFVFLTTIYLAEAVENDVEVDVEVETSS